MRNAQKVLHPRHPPQELVDVPYFIVSFLTSRKQPRQHRPGSEEMSPRSSTAWELGSADGPDQRNLLVLPSNDLHPGRCSLSASGRTGRRKYS